MAASNTFPKTAHSDGAATAASPSALPVPAARGGRGREPSGGCRIAA
jgi:hypothetical protein